AGRCRLKRVAQPTRADRCELARREQALDAEYGLAGLRTAREVGRPSGLQRPWRAPASLDIAGIDVRYRDVDDGGSGRREFLQDVRHVVRRFALSRDAHKELPEHANPGALERLRVERVGERATAVLRGAGRGLVLGVRA